MNKEKQKANEEEEETEVVREYAKELKAEGRIEKKKPSKNCIDSQKNWEKFIAQNSNNKATKTMDKVKERQQKVAYQLDKRPNSQILLQQQIFINN